MASSHMSTLNLKSSLLSFTALFSRVHSDSTIINKKLHLCNSLNISIQLSVHVMNLAQGLAAALL